MIARYIPNTVTLSNLFCGCMTLICLFTEQLSLVPVFIAVSLFADYCDGLLARLLKVNSPVGRELDSLADMVSFGVVPGAMLFYLLNEARGVSSFSFSNPVALLSLVGFLVTLFSCLRLAKFNLDTRQTEGFVGLNTPACTIFVLGLLLMEINDAYGLREWVLNDVVLCVVSVLLSYLLIAEIPMFSFKFKALEWKGNRIRISFLVVIVLCFALFKLGVALSAIILCYVLISVVLWMAGALKREKRAF